MRYLYLDNLRGFRNTCVPLADVNFLVGENGTGKTTILNLINLLASPRFWLTQDFNTDEVRLGSFREIVNIGSQRQVKFQLGVVQSLPPKSKHRGPQAILLTFTEEEGLPHVCRYNFCQEGEEVRVVHSRNAIEYKVSPMKRKDENPLRVLQRWIREKPEEDAGYTRIVAKDIPFPAMTSLAFAMGFLLAKSRSRKGDAELVFPRFTPFLQWLGPIRSKPRRTYDEYTLDATPEGDHTPYLIRRLVNSRAKTSKRSLAEIQSAAKAAGLFDSIKVKEFGKGAGSPFALDVIIGGAELRIVNTGYGISQALPVIVELLARPKGGWYAIQQPEIHLHPKAQAALGDLFFELAVEKKKRFFIETHSDFIIDRFRLNYRKSNRPGIQSQVLFFARGKTGIRVYPIGINEKGEYSDKQPSAFRDFFVREQLALLGL